MKTAPDFDRDLLNRSLQAGARELQHGHSLAYALDTAVQSIRDRQGLSMLEEVRLREWLQDELPDFARTQKDTDRADEATDDEPVAELFQQTGPHHFSPVGKAPFIFPPLWLYRLIDGRIARKLEPQTVLRRKIIAGGGAIAFAVAGLFPPWIQTFDLNTTHTSIDAGYAFIGSPPEPKEYSFCIGIKMDTSRLLIELACIFAVTIAVWFLFGGEKSRKTRR